MKAGDIFSHENLRIVRPGNGLHPRYYEIIIGRSAVCDIKKGSPMTWNLL